MGTVSIVLLVWAIVCLLFVLFVSRAHRFNSPQPCDCSQSNVDEVVNEYENSVLRQAFFPENNA